MHAAPVHSPVSTFRQDEHLHSENASASFGKVSATCKHAAKAQAELKGRQVDGERMACANGLDVHYELNAVAIMRVCACVGSVALWEIQFFFPRGHRQPTPPHPSTVSCRHTDKMSTTIPKMLPLNSEKFLAPASCKHAAKEDAELKEQNPDRERMVCAIGLDVHYELNVVANEAGAYQPRLKPFNPRMSGPACPPNYTGKFISEAEHRANRDDPIALGRLIEQETPYDKDLYLKRDPRLVSKTVVVRDYGCKIPIDLSDTEKIAKAVLNHYPDQYVAFLGEFVSNIFGASMRQFLEVQQAGLQKLLDNADELNRVSWGAYMAVQGGVDPTAPIDGKTSKHVMDRMLEADCTLSWTDDIATALGQLTRDGRAMTGQCTSEDVYNLRPCIQQHIETLERMRTHFCRGFGSKEVHVLAMLWYSNEQGRKLCHDLQLMSESDTPSYDKVTMHVPLNLFYSATKSGAADAVDDYTTKTLPPELNSTIKASLSEEKRQVSWTPTLQYPVGNWSGNADSVNVFLKTSSPAPYQWGWGHASNVSLRHKAILYGTGGVGYEHILLAPHLRYTYDSTLCLLSVTHNRDGMQNEGRAFVKDERWGGVFADGALVPGPLSKALPTPADCPVPTLRDSIMDTPSQHPFRGSNRVWDGNYRAVTADYFTTRDPRGNDTSHPGRPAISKSPIIPPSTLCAQQDAFPVINRRWYPTTCETMEPFLSTGGRCIQLKDGKVHFPLGEIAPFNIKNISKLGVFQDVVEGSSAITCGQANMRYHDLNTLYISVKEPCAIIWGQFWQPILDPDRNNPEVYIPQDGDARRTDAGAKNFDENVKNFQAYIVLYYLGFMARCVNRVLNMDPISQNVFPGNFSTSTVSALSNATINGHINDIDEFTKHINETITTADIDECLAHLPDPAADYAHFASKLFASDEFTAEKYLVYPTLIEERASGTETPFHRINGGISLANKSEQVVYLLMHMLMEWWEKNDTLTHDSNTLSSLIEHASFSLVIKLSRPIVPNVSHIPRILPAYEAAKLSETWPVRTLFNGMPSGKQWLLPFLNQVDTWADWRRTLPTNMLDMSAFDFKKNATFEFTSSDIGRGVESGDPFAVQILLLRLVIQSSMGMFIGGLLCDNVFDCDYIFPDLVTPILTRGHTTSETHPQAVEWTKIWKNAGEDKYDFVVDKDTGLLQMRKNKSVLSLEIATKEIMRLAYMKIKARLNLFFDSSEYALDSKKSTITTYLTRLKKHAALIEWVGNKFVECKLAKTMQAYGLNGVATDLIVQSGVTAYPVFLYAGTLESFHLQFKEVPPNCQAHLNNDGSTGNECVQWMLDMFDKNKSALAQMWNQVETKYKGTSDVYRSFAVPPESPPRRDEPVAVAQLAQAPSDEPPLSVAVEAAASAAMASASASRPPLSSLPQPSSLLRSPARAPTTPATGPPRASAPRPPLSSLPETLMASDPAAAEEGDVPAPAGSDVDDQLAIALGREEVAAQLARERAERNAELDAQVAMQLAREAAERNAEAAKARAQLDAATKLQAHARAQAGRARARAEAAEAEALGPGGVAARAAALQAAKAAERAQQAADAALAEQKQWIDIVRAATLAAQRAADAAADAAKALGPGGGGNPTDPTSPEFWLKRQPGSSVEPLECKDGGGPRPEPIGVKYAHSWVKEIDLGAGQNITHLYPCTLQKITPARCVRGAVALNADNDDDHEKEVTVMPISSAPYDRFTQPATGAYYNYNMFRPQFFSVIDAAALLWHAREFINPADSNRPAHYESGQPSDMHPWCIGLCETFMYAREKFLLDHKDELWEREVKTNPSKALPPSFIGRMCEESWKRYFPLLPCGHELRKELGKIRALEYMWGTLPAYNGGQAFGTKNEGAWMPLSMAHQVRLLDSVGLFDHKYHVPRNPWLAHNGQGISRVFNQSYHSVYHNDSYRAPHFRQWLKEACRYQPPNAKCYYPFSQYGGTPVEADFVHHRVERPDRPSERRHKQLMYNRFGFHGPLRLGQQFHDTGLLQDLFAFEYRPYADLSPEQRAMPAAEAVYPSSFLAYARNHAIIALASCNHGTEEPSVPRIVRNLYRLYVDTYECMGVSPDDDGVPCVMGFLPSPIRGKEDRPVILYAGSLTCLNTKLERFCNSTANKGERVCQIYKQVYLNDATMLFTRLMRAERRKLLHENNYARALVKRQGNYTRERFNDDLIELQDAYIDFLQTTILGMLLESGADLNNAPLHLLEPRELEVSMLEEDDNVVGNDYLTPGTAEMIKGMDFSGDNLSRSQLAILSLIPPNNRILGTLRLNQSTEIIDLEHAKKQIQKETIASNKKVWQRYSEALIGAAFGQKLLEVEGPIDFGFDMTALQDPRTMKFNMADIRDPLRESEGIAKKLSTTGAQASSSLSQALHGEALRQERGPESVLGMNSVDFARALQAVRDRVERDYSRSRGGVPKVKCLALLKIPEHIKRVLRPEYEN